MKTWLGDFLNDLGQLFAKAFNYATEKVIDGEIVLVWFVTLGLTGVLFGLGGLIYKSVTSDDRVHYCTIESAWAHGFDTKQEYFKVIGHVEWRTDILIAEVPQLAIAIELADSGVCNQ